MRANGSHQRVLVDEPAWADAGPSFTADGRRVLYSRCGGYIPPFFTCKIVSVRLDGSGRRTVVGGTWHPGDPVMSPDGSTLAYVSDAGGYEARVWVADADGAHRHAITPPVGFERVMWSPDGTELVVTGYRTGSLFTSAADGTGLEEIAPGVIFGAWSPDGSRIVGSVDFGDGSSQLHTYAADGSDATPIVDASLWTGYSDWGVAR
jgi:Tol biopolymer transport system component